MKTWAAISVGACSFLMIGFLTPAQPGGSIRDQLIGTWVLVSNSDKNSDGMPKWGENPKGSLIFEANGRYSFIIVRSDLPKFTANFGTFTVDEAKSSFTTNIEGSVYPNIGGKSVTRTITAIGPDEVRYTNTTTSTGGSA
ncbi:MAG: hypothetical protein WCF47_22800, partial [Pseudolabrys sp.]